MKKAGKVILYIFLTIVLLIVLLVVVAALAENKIVKIAINQVSQTTNIPIQVDDVDFSLINNFPYATIRCTNLWISSPASKEAGNQDTLVYIERLYVSVDVKPLLKSVFNVRKIEIEDAELFYRIDTAGISNFDFLIDTTQQNEIDTSANAIYLDIKSLDLNNVMCHYKDEKLKASADLLIGELDLSGLIEEDQYNGEAEGQAFLSNCKFDSTRIYLMNQANLDFKLEYRKGVLNIERAEIAIDEDVRVGIIGSLALGDSLTAELQIKGEKFDLEGLSKYVPESVFEEYDIRDLSGVMVADATVSGLITDSVMPFVDVTFELVNGNMQYDDYPELKNMSLKGKATNGKQKNNATTSIDINQLSFQTANSNIKLSAKLENPDKMTYKVNSTVNLDLEEIAPFIPDTLLQSLVGKVNAKISTKGMLPDSINEEFIHSMLANTQAGLKLMNVNASVDSSLSVNQLNVQLNYQSNQIEINDLSATIPSYNVDVINLNAALNGDFTKPDSLHLEIKNLLAHLKSYNLDIKNLNAGVDGNFTKPESLDIKINSFIAASENSNIELSGNVKNPFEPDYSITGKINLDLDEIQKFLPDSLVNSMSGNVSANFKSAAHLNLDSLSSQIYELLFDKSNFSAQFDEVSIDMPDTVMNVSHLSGQLEYHADTFHINQIGLNYQGMQLGMNAVTASNLYSAVLQNQAKELNVTGNFSVDDLDYAFLEKFTQYDSARAEELEDAPLNFSYKIKGRFKANSIKYDDALLQNIDTKFLFKTSYFVFDNLKMDAFDGQSVSSVKIEMQPDEKIDIYFKTDVSKMDVHKILNSFGEYVEYEDIKAENVKGIITTKMDGKIVLQNYEPVYGSLMLNGDLTIENGALLNVKPVMEVEKIKGIGLKNMDKLYFSTLNSNIFLFNNELYIPRTEIKSTSFDAMFLGMYSFGEDYDYHIRMFLGEVLSSKSKANLKKLTLEGGFDDEDDKEVTKGRTSIYVVSKSENGKEKAGFDNKRDRLNMSAKVKLQKQMVDMSFHPALVKYNTDE